MKTNNSINISIETAKIKDEWLVTGKTGKQYLSIRVYANEEPDKYGNTHAVTQVCPKELRQEGQKAWYIGNGKVYDNNAPFTSKPKSSPQPTKPIQKELSEDVPF